VELKRLHNDGISERNALLHRVRELEVQSDDNRALGKLQREVMALRATYQSFASSFPANTNSPSSTTKIRKV